MLMSLALILAGTTIWAQQVDIHGTVLDDLGEGLPGATVKEKANANNGTLTDLDGHFTLKLAVFSMNPRATCPSTTHSIYHQS
jgi:hypothetical protein